MIYIGTSGFQYPEWKGTFYPEIMPAAKMLAYYSERFSTTESNYTFRQMPKTATLEKWAAQTPPGFRFSLKAPQRITHFARLQNCEDTLRYFCDTAGALGEKLGPVLFQLPPSFKKDVVVLESFLRDLPSGFRAAFEFRHDSWFDEEVFAALRAANVALCIAHSDELATPVVATADYGYLRLREVLYGPEDFTRWAQAIRSQPGWKETFVYFKHEEAGTGPQFAQALIEALK
ncbi:MAG: hypothetical protein JWQ44_2095 [Chthoniobacter sp.]|nr:hypothetical protein [Chthoniobacter sp.]